MIKQKPLLMDTVDRLGEVEERLNTPEVARWKADEKAAAELRKQLNSICGGRPEETLTLHGLRYTAVLSIRENERSIVSLEKLFNKVGKKTFLQACSFTLTAFDTVGKWFEPAEKAALVSEARTGPRSVKTFKRVAERAA